MDDSPILRQATRRAVTQAGVEEENILEAGSGAEALAVLDGNDVDMILLDLHMPGMDGAAFAREARGGACATTAPIVVVATADERAQGEALGADGFLPKPFDADELRGLVDDLVGGDA
ncbi:MAG: response regulator [Planctomycetota bacterium]